MQGSPGRPARDAPRPAAKTSARGDQRQNCASPRAPGRAGERPRGETSEGGRARREPGGANSRQRGETGLMPRGPAPCVACTLLPEPSAQPRAPGHLRPVLCRPRAGQKLYPRESSVDAARSPGTSAQGFLLHRHPIHGEAERRPSQVPDSWRTGAAPAPAGVWLTYRGAGGVGGARLLRGLLFVFLFGGRLNGCFQCHPQELGEMQGRRDPSAFQNDRVAELQSKVRENN